MQYENVSDRSYRAVRALVPNENLRQEKFNYEIRPYKVFRLVRFLGLSPVLISSPQIISDKFALRRISYVKIRLGETTCERKFHYNILKTTAVVLKIRLDVNL